MLMVAVVAAVFLLTTAGVAVGGAVLAAHRARAAADLSALAGAVALGRGEPGPGACRVARSVAVRNRAELVLCTTGVDGTVAVRARVPVTVGLPGQPGAAHAVARAGPAQ